MNLEDLNIRTYKGSGLGPFLFDPPRPFKPEGFTVVSLDPEDGNPVVHHHPHRWEAHPVVVTNEGAKNADQALAALESVHRRLIVNLHEKAVEIFGIPEPLILEYQVMAQAITGDKKNWLGELQLVAFAVKSEDDWKD